MAILRLLIFDKGSWYAKKSLYTLFQAWVTKVQCCLLQKCKCRLRSADSASGPNEMSTLGCALRCLHTLPASILTVTITKRLTAEITVTTRHRNWGSTLSLFLFFYFLVFSDKNDPLFPMNTLLHAVALPLFLPPLPSASQSITTLQ